MATATWPAELPDSPLVNGYERSLNDSRLFSIPDAGKPKIRNRYTATTYNVTEVYLFTLDEFDVFETFYKNILGNGAEEFIKHDPVSSLSGAYRFREEMYSTSYEFPYMRVSMALELTL